MTLRRRILIRIYFLTFLIILAMSVTYYYLFTRDIRERSYQNVTLVFNLVFDDLQTRVQSVLSKIDHFVQADLVNPMNVIQLFQEQQDPSEEEVSIWNIKKLMTYLSSMASGMYEFGTLIDATEVFVYDTDRNLLAAYQALGNEKIAGVYLPRVDDEAFVLIQPDDIWYATLQDIAEIPLQPLPKHFPTFYHGDIPEAMSVKLSTFMQLVTIRFVVPVMLADDMAGVCVIHLGIHQKDVARYSHLTQTKVNVFAGTTFSVGTLPEYNAIAGEISDIHQNIDLLDLPEIPILTFSDMMVRDQSYYQGTLLIGDDDKLVAGITALLPRELEEKQKRNFFIVIVGIALLFSLLAAAEAFRLSATIVRPIMQMIQVLQKLTSGDLKGVRLDTMQTPPGHKGRPLGRKDPSNWSSHQTASELTALAQAIQTMVDYLQDVAIVAESISHGEIEQEIAPRSEQDVLGHAFHHMTEYLHQIAAMAAAMARGDLQQEIQPRTPRDILGNALQQLIKYVQSVADVAETISDGDLRVAVQPKSDQDVLNQSLKKMVMYLQDVAIVATTISDGDLQVDVQPKSEQDILNRSLGNMVKYIQDVAGVAEKISKQKLDVEVRPRSDQDVLNHALQRMVTTLQTMMREIEQSMQEVEQQNWLKTGQAEFNVMLRGEQDIVTLGQRIINYLANHVQAQIGAIYVIEQNQILQLIATYAYPQRKGIRNQFRIGESLVGQAALEKQDILFTDVPDTYVKISSGFGEVAPQNILVMPCMYEGQVRGVIELGASHTLTDIQQEFLKQITEGIAIAFHSAEARIRMQELLEATQQQAETLQQQQEQLRASNEELEDQTLALKASEEKLQSQQEELKLTNEELEEQARTLEHQKVELEDKNVALEKAQQLVEEKAKDLELSNKYKTEFLANMSHELRTPLNSLLILSKVLTENKQGNLTGKQVEFARTIYSAGVDLLALINDVLDLSKVEAGKILLNIEEIEVRRLADYIEQNFAHVTEDKGLYLKVNISDDIPELIQTDRQRVEQILKNFLSNAIKFTSEGGVTVSIGRPQGGVIFAQSGFDPRTTIAFAVSDTGIGIPEDKLRLVFEAFQQADGTTSRRFGGTGLGLSISKELVTLLSGEIDLQSEEGKGSVFTLYLPQRWVRQDATQHVGYRAPVPHEPEHATEPLLSAAAASSAGIQPVVSDVDEFRVMDDRHNFSSTKKSLLIIDDDPKFIKILFDLAHESGFQCLLAEDGEAGLQLADQYLPSAIILDIALPRINGWTVMERLKANTDTGHIPVHFITAQDQSLKAAKMGAIGYLTKPVSLDELEKAFETIEATIPHTIKQVLMVENDEAMRTSILDLLGGEHLNIMNVSTGREAYMHLKQEKVDCMVIDLNLADISGFDLLNQIRVDTEIPYLPIIVYTDKELTKQETLQLQQYAESTVIKSTGSPQRILDEIMLFLRQVEGQLYADQQQELHLVDDEEVVLQDKTILVVDDDMRNAFALSVILEEKGIQTQIAENGKDALGLVETRPELDLVLMDIMMPEMDGYETMRTIRKQSKFDKLPLIALTAKAMRGDRQKCIEAGANDYLSKPIDTDKLMSLLRVWLH